MLVAVVILAAVAVASRWRLMGNAARAIGRLPRLQNWVGGKQSIIDSAEHNLLTFYHKAPAAFWASLTLISYGTGWQSWRSISSCGLWEQGSPWSARLCSKA